MAPTFVAAFAKLSGPQLDLVQGLAVLPYPRRRVEPAIIGPSATLARSRVVAERAVVSRFGCRREDAEEAVQDALCQLLEGRRELFREDSANWLRTLINRAFYCFLSGRRAAAGFRSLMDPDTIAGLAAGEDLCEVRPELATDYRHVLPPGLAGDWTASQAIGAVQRFERRRGRTPRTRDCRKVNQLPSLATIRKLFGSLDSALLDAGLAPHQGSSRRWSPIDAARVSRAFRLRNGRWPDRADFCSNPDLPGEKVAKRCFGGTREGLVQVQAEAILAAAARRG